MCRPNLISWNTSGEWDYPLAIFGLMLDNWRVLGRDTDSHTHIGLQRVIIGSRPTRILDIDSYQPLYKVFTVKVPWPTSLTSSLSCHFFVRRRLYFCMYFRDPEAFQAVLWIQRWPKEPAYRWDTLIPANCHTFGVFLPYYIMTFTQRKNVMISGFLVSWVFQRYHDMNDFAVTIFSRYSTLTCCINLKHDFHHFYLSNNAGQ